MPTLISIYVRITTSITEFSSTIISFSFLSFIPLLLFLFFYTKPAFLLCSLSLFLFSFFPFYLCRFQYLSLAHSSLSFFTDQFHFKSLTLIQYLQASWDQCFAASQGPFINANIRAFYQKNGIKPPVNGNKMFETKESKHKR